MYYKHNFAGYIEYLGNQYFCTVNDYVVKMFYKNEPGILGLENDDDKEEKYIFGFSENDCPFAVLMSQGIRYDSFNPHIPYHFCTPILIKAKSSAINNLTYFDGIEFYGETVNKIFNPRQAMEHSKLSPKSKVEDINIAFKPPSDYSKKFDIEIDGQKAKLEYLIYRYVHLAEQRNEDGSISLGSLNSAVRIKFENQKPLESIKRYWVAFNNLLVFLTGRHNVDFGVRLFQKNESDLLSHTADGFFRRSKNDIYNDIIEKTIQLNALGNKFPELFKLFIEDKTSPYLRFLPENNKMANRISDADVLNICTAFEIEFGRDDTKDKNKIVSDYEDDELNWKKGNLILPKRIWFLCQKATDFSSENVLRETKKAIVDFVSLRNSITHSGVIEWGDCGKFSITLVKVLYVNILLRAKLDMETAVKITERKWGM